MCTPCNICFIGSRVHTTQTASRSVQPLLHSSRQIVVGHARACPFLKKLPLRLGRSRPTYNTRFLGSTRVHNPNGISVGSAIFCTAHVSIVSSGIPGHVLSHKNCAFAWGDLDPSLIHGFLAHASPQSKRHVDRLSRFCRSHYLRDRPTP